MLFEIVTLAGSVFTGKEVMTGVHAWLDEADTGSVLGMWITEIGPIGNLLVMRSFENTETLAVERERALRSKNPFGSSSAGARLTMESYAPFPFLPAPTPRNYGGLFELRTYYLVTGGLPATLVGWKQAIAPAHAYTDHLVTALYALDGAPRITHLWGFSSLEERNELRREHYAAGLWPPKGGPEHIDNATSTIALAVPNFPIR